MLDSEIETYKKKIVVLNARVKILSDRENERLHGNYFPESQETVSTHNVTLHNVIVDNTSSHTLNAAVNQNQFQDVETLSKIMVK